MTAKDSKLKLTFYGGVKGLGNMVLLEDLELDARILLDFGTNPKNIIRHPKNIQEIQNTGLIPLERDITIKNLYSTHFILEDGQKKGVKDRACAGKKDPETNLDGIFISHAHRDHYYGLPLVNRNIPIYIGDYTKKIIDARSKASPVAIDNYYTGLEWKIFRTGDIIDIKGLKIHPVHVDHSIPAAYGFVIETSGGLVVYSGDFRMHGPLKFMTYDLIKKTNELSSEHNLEILALICEGTFIHKGSIESERRVKCDLKALTKDIPFDYFIVKYNCVDWDRFRTYVNIAKKIGWKYIIAEKEAYFYHVLNSDPNWESMRNPSILNEDNILIVEQENNKGFLYGWQKELRQAFRVNRIQDRFMKLSDVRNLKAKFFLYYMVLREPYRAILPSHLVGALLSTDIDQYSDDHHDNNLTNNLKSMGFISYRIQASGHAKPHDIYEFAAEINPEKLFPIHSDHPRLFINLFRNTSIDVILPKLYKENFI